MFLVFRLTILTWLFGWFFKFKFLSRHYGFYTFVYPFFHEQFPAFFLDPAVSYIAFYLPLVAILVFLTNSRVIARGVSLVMLICAGILGLHINSYSDMTYISSFWVAMWLLWYAFHLDDPDHLRQHAPRLAQCVIGLLFLGGTVGKLTPEYWGGEAFHQLVVLDTPGFVGQLLTAFCPLQQQQFIMSILSKLIIVCEALLVLSPFYHYRFFAVFGVLTIVMLVLFRSWQILSVLSCLGGMVLACLLMVNRPQEEMVRS